MLYNNMCELVGNTPIVELKKTEEKFALKGKLFAKIEYFNPAGSVKDRIALNMVEDFERRGILKEGGTIIEPTSGNTGIGLAFVAAVKGYKAIFVMPDSMSIERRKLLKAYGAELVLTEGKLGMKGAVEKAEELCKTIENSCICSQFSNPANPAAHKKTADEIWTDLNGNVDVLVASFGTGGTVSGTGKRLKQLNKDLFVVAVEPKESPLLTEGKAGPHGIQGIGANFVPDNLDKTVVDEFFDVKTADAYEFSRYLARSEGLCVGISSGAALKAAIDLLQKDEFSDKNVVVILPDGGDKYLSTPLFE